MQAYYMGTYCRTQARQYLNKPKDYTAISKKTGGNAGLRKLEINAQVTFKETPLRLTAQRLHNTAVAHGTPTRYGAGHRVSLLGGGRASKRRQGACSRSGFLDLRSLERGQVNIGFPCQMPATNQTGKTGRRSLFKLDICAPDDSGELGEIRLDRRRKPVRRGNERF